MINEKAEFKTKDYPVLRVTNMTHEDFWKFLDYVKAMPAAKDFKLVEVQFLLDTHGQGPESGGRIIDRVMLWFEFEGVEEEYIIGVKAWNKVLGFQGSLNLDNYLYDREKKTGWQMQNGIMIDDYDWTDKKPPVKFGFTFKYYSKEQRKIEDEAKTELEEKNKRNLYNTVADAIKNDDRVRTQIERLLKEKK